MALLSAIRVRFEPLRSLGFASISGVYAGVGSPFITAPRLVKFTNLTDANLLVSLNGVNDHDVIPAGGFCLYDWCSNKSDAGGSLEQCVGDRIYVKEESTAATSGNVYVTVVYASDM